ncbi:MAG: hypothetical protein P8046_02960 [Anaerolineales bacterium]
MKKLEQQFHQKMNQIFSSSDPEIDRLAAGFHFILNRELAESQLEMELLRALGDKDSLVKEQIKHSTIQHAASIFADCYFRATGERWTPEEEAHV